MKSFIFLAVIVCMSFAEEDPSKARVVAYENEVSPDGSFYYSYEGSDGSKAFQEGSLRYVDETHAGQAVKGSYQYRDKDGQIVTVTYTADENGYRPEGENIPKIPPLIAKSLQYIKEHPTEKP